MSSSGKRPIDAEFRSATTAALGALSEKMTDTKKEVAEVSERSTKNREEGIRTDQRLIWIEKDIEIILSTVNGMRAQQLVESKARTDWEGKQIEVNTKQRIVTGIIQVIATTLLSAFLLGVGSMIVNSIPKAQSHPANYQYTPAR